MKHRYRLLQQCLQPYFDNVCYLADISNEYAGQWLYFDVVIIVDTVQFFILTTRRLSVLHSCWPSVSLTFFLFGGLYKYGYKCNATQIEAGL